MRQLLMQRYAQHAAPLPCACPPPSTHTHKPQNKDMPGIHVYVAAGTSVPLPDGYCGLLLQQAHADTDTCARQWTATGHFRSGFVMWGHSAAPPPKTEPTRRALEWLDVAKQASVTPTCMRITWVMMCRQQHPHATTHVRSVVPSIVHVHAHVRTAPPHKQ